AQSTVPLTFQVTAGEVSTTTGVSNVAAISSAYQRFVRVAQVTVLPAGSAPPEPAPELAASLKVAGKRLVAVGETLNYTIYLINSGTADALVDVLDPLPAAMAYVAGSASPSASYDPATRTLSWVDVLVPSGAAVELAFQVTVEAEATPGVVVNTATISTDSQTYQRNARVAVVPVPPGIDVVPPRLVQLRIGESDVLTDPNVQLHITAQDNVDVSRMKILEWTLSSGRVPRWQLVQSTDWIPFQADYPWQLSAQSGTHFVGVWLADGARNVSAMTRRAIDFASLLLPSTPVGRDEAVAYLVHYEAGDQVTASLTTHSGDADLYVWFPGNHRLPDQASTQEGTAPDGVSFTAPRTGTYLFVVYGHAESIYDLAIGSGDDGTAQAAASVVPSAKPGLQADPVLTRSGVIPLGPASTPQPYNLRLPLILLR
ncbi:MAG: pre-peptidase C-terminal domain-containing protein, partial [Anaerolineae bacterium]